MIRLCLCTVLILMALPLNAEFIRKKHIRVVDGDTIAIGQQKYRLVGFDTPETYYAKCEYEKALGDAATNRLKQLIDRAGGAELIVLPGLDKYRRGLARLKVGNQDVGSILISEGLARPYEGGKRQPWC